MSVLTGASIAVALAGTIYLALGFTIVRSLYFWSSIAMTPTEKATKTISSLDINFERVGYNGDKLHYANPSGLLNFPGPDLSDEVCISSRYLDKEIELCYWVEKRELQVSDPYYPKGLPECRGKANCPLKKSVPVGIQAKFYPQHGLASTIIPSSIDSKLALYNSSKLSKVKYEIVDSGRIWIRSFNWLYEGSYNISFRPFSKFKFTFLWPSLLPSGKPKFICGLCSEAVIEEDICSDDAFL
ncbi:hypothetical protein DSO57_1004352 [Entomophthora muscae]|uniref:Uncharacterized protein n=1 Tax=Entomophthora muscae TaxID=34485 RepID=A0ACC2T833_9FUNG|nr:hypothetical protein DSO57_1004352 [Entomophthora muscae]